MSALPNSHQALLKNSDCLVGRTVFLGLSDPGLLDRIAGNGLVMTENAGTLALLQSSHPDWQAAFGYDDPILGPGLADTVAIFMPKSRTELSLRLALAVWLVADGGRVLLVGEKKEGIAGGVRQMKEVLPESGKLDSARHCQVWQAKGVSTSRFSEFRLADWVKWHTVESNALAIEVAGLPGIFSDGELDAGTALLLDTLARSPLVPGRALDFACGAGVIGAWLQTLQARDGGDAYPVEGLDVQFQAVTCARLTYDRAGAQGTIAASDGLPASAGPWQSVVTNPPFHTGVRTDMSVTERFLESVSRHLVKGGELRLVANRFLPYRPLIEQHIGRASVLAENTKFVVWSAFKP
ncbi:methyltransferase [Marinobacter confluentis]|uniref:Ribosomal RNA small subunit methyltransferase C n=1 Tax=Marinobacter confluentis TaxID=1697557 RepID=A0A4Z1CBG0_9GAMM|nr:methyltransferase [Marinobacter confluentis]TGN41273.1 class I SAM-dependent methyltransferase [Marinobacter confluentis]